MTTLFTEQPNIPLPMKSNEWYTPSRYIEAARKVMNGIDLDPASCEMANKIVKAKKFYTVEDDGLSKEWSGNVWLNPPYGKTIPYESHGRYMGGGNTKNTSLQTMFIKKALVSYQLKQINQAILLVTANTTVSWFRPLWDFPMCTPYPKIRFQVQGIKEKQAQVFGNVFVYFGLNEQLFIDVFSKFGRIAKAIDTPKAKPATLPLWEVQS